MISVLVQFMPQNKLPWQEVASRFKASVPHYRNIPRMVRKYYTLGDDGACGGIYLFKTRSEAEAFFTEAWKEEMQARFGDRPRVTFYDSPVIIDNAAGEVYSEV